MKPTKLARATCFLSDILSTGALLASEIRQHAEIHGHSWRTIERAAREIGITKVKTAAGWIWSNEKNGAVIQFNAAKAQGRQDRQVKTANPQDRQTPPVRTNWTTRPRAWARGAFKAVRCAHCAHACEIRDMGTHGYCDHGEKQILFLYGNRNCAEFVHDQEGP
ncbi:MAG: hypothetical protein U9Q81_12045 [Pseudomonadota bacterium]|nr:hypothetical protein [Pseudomonadota bacterium]